MVRRALFGGSFDPVHNGHVALVHHLLAARLADVVHVLPAWQSPHKPATFASAEHRLAMVHLAWPGTPCVIVDEREIVSPSPCFTFHTLEALCAEHPTDRWLLVIGADNLQDFPRWHQADKIKNMAHLVVMGRGVQNLDAATLHAAGLEPSNVTVVPDFEVAISASGIREMIGSGDNSHEPLVALGLPEPVAEYVLMHCLYRGDENPKDRSS